MTKIKEDKAVIIEESTYLTLDNLERVLLSQGWRKPKGRVRTRSKFLPPGRGSTAGNYPNYNGKKNPYCSDLKPLKYFNCKCDNDQKGSCPCVYHLLTIVLRKRREESPSQKPNLVYACK